MNDSENKKTPEELADEALENVSGGSDDVFFTIISFRNNFKSRNNCTSCNSYYRSNCLLKLTVEGLYDKFSGDNNAMCPYKT